MRTILQKNPGLDARYIRNWLKQFDASSEEKYFFIIFKDILNECAET